MQSAPIDPSASGSSVAAFSPSPPFLVDPLSHFPDSPLSLSALSSPLPPLSFSDASRLMRIWCVSVPWFLPLDLVDSCCGLG